MRWIFAIFSISFLWSGIATQAFGQDDSGDSQVNWSAPPRRHQPNPDVQNAAPQQPAAQTPVIPATPAATSPRPATSIPSVAPSASVPAGVPEPVISPVAAGSCGAAWPKVNFQNGMLAVDAPGCSLAEVLNAIQRASGIQFVMAEGSVGAPGVLLPVTVNLGPAPAKMVIQGLFRDVPFDYLMVGPAEAPQTVRFWRIPPQVSFHRGLLSVEAADSSLSEVLDAIQQETGIRFQGAEGAQERVAVKLGPAPVHDVIRDFFDGSRFNFVIVDKTNAEVSRVILSPAQDGPLPGEEAPAIATEASAESAEEQPQAPILPRRRRFAQPPPQPDYSSTVAQQPPNGAAGQPFVAQPGAIAVPPPGGVQPGVGLQSGAGAPPGATTPGGHPTD